MSSAVTERAPQRLLVFGNWRLRHAEAMYGEVARLRLHALPDAIRGAARGVQIDCRTELPVVAYCSEDDWYEASLQPPTRCENVAADWVPLAILQRESSALRLTHLVDRADRHVTHFMAPTRPVAAFTPADTYWQLYHAFQANHLFTNNYECYYSVAACRERRCLRFDAPGVDVTGVDIHALGDAWLDHLGSASAGAFVAQIGEELQLASHDNLLCEILPHLHGTRGWVNAALHSRKRKVEVLDPLAQLRTVSMRDSGPPHVSEIGDVLLGTSAEETIALTCDLPLRAGLRWRRTACTIGCESLASGHVFHVSFTCNRLLSTGAIALCGCEIEYRKTRGDSGGYDIDSELQQLFQQLRAWLSGLGLQTTLQSDAGGDWLYDRLGAARHSGAQGPEAVA